MERNWALEERICEYFGIELDSLQETLILDMCRYVDVDTMNAMLKSIATDYEIETEEDE